MRRRNDGPDGVTRTSPSPWLCYTSTPKGPKCCYRYKTNSFSHLCSTVQTDKGNKESYLQVNAVVGLGAINCEDTSAPSGRGEGLDALELLCELLGVSKQQPNPPENTICGCWGGRHCDLMRLSLLPQ